MSDSKYAPGTYAKGDDQRVARSAADAVALVFEGYQRVDDDAPVNSVEAPQASVSETAAKPDAPKPEAPKPSAPKQRPATNTPSTDQE